MIDYMDTMQMDMTSISIDFVINVYTKDIWYKMHE